MNSDYNYWTANGANADNPATASVPVVNTPSLTAKSQIFPAAGQRNKNGEITYPGTHGWYWTNTPSTFTVGHLFWYNINGIYVVDSGNGGGSVPTYSTGYSIRCVRP